MIKTKNQPDTFVTGRGNVSGELAKSNEEVLHEEAEELEIEAEGVQGTEGGHKPVYATPNSFHEGRGLGRGHGPETK